MEIDYKLIGQRIRDARKKKKISQEALSEKIDVSVAYLSRIERGHPGSLNKYAQISRILDIKLEYLLTGTIVKREDYLDQELYETLIKCTPTKQRLIYNIAKIVSNAKFI